LFSSTVLTIAKAVLQQQQQQQSVHCLVMSTHEFLCFWQNDDLVWEAKTSVEIFFVNAKKFFSDGFEKRKCLRLLVMHSRNRTGSSMILDFFEPWF